MRGFAGDDDDFRTGAAYNPTGSYNYPTYDTLDTGYSAPPVVTVEQGNAGGGSSSGGVFDFISGLFKSAATGITGVASMVNVHGQPVPGTFPAAQQPAPGMPGWVIPVVAGAGILALLVVLKSRRSQMAGYRRRTRRIRRSRR